MIITNITSSPFVIRKRWSSTWTSTLSKLFWASSFNFCNAKMLELWKLQNKYIFLPLLYTLHMKLSKNSKLLLVMGFLHNVNSHKVLLLFLFVALFQPIRIHYTMHEFATQNCFQTSYFVELVVYCPHRKNAPVYFLGHFFINETRSFDFVDRVGVGHLCFLVHDHPQHFYKSNKSFIIVMAIHIAIMITRTK